MNLVHECSAFFYVQMLPAQGAGVPALTAAAAPVLACMADIMACTRLFKAAGDVSA
jgi:hypothetical protein